MPSGYCKVPGCDKTLKKSLRNVYTLPRPYSGGDLTPAGKIRLERRTKWLMALGKDPSDCESDIFVCGEHFVKGKPAPIGNKDDVDWVPTLLLGSQPSVGGPQQENLSEQAGALVECPVTYSSHKAGEFGECSEGATILSSCGGTQQENLSEQAEALVECPVTDSSHKTGEFGECSEGATISSSCGERASINFTEDESSTSSPGGTGEHMDAGLLRAENSRLKSENEELKEALKNALEDSHEEKERNKSENDELRKKLEEVEKMNKLYQEDFRVSEEKVNELKSLLEGINLSEETFRGNDTRVKYMTGLPTFDIMMTMFREVEPHIPTGSRGPCSALSKFQQFILTLLRMRLDLEFVLLGFLFRVSEHTASRMFFRTLDVMYVRYQSLVFWPSRESLHQTMPMDFREKFGLKVSVIIDCFEVFMNRPSNPLAAAQVYSNYKKHSTVKFLIGVCPQGSIVFISRGYGGRASDQHITRTCGFLDNLLPGDIVLADRGFTVHELVRLQRAEMYMPSFKKKGENQLQPAAVELSRKISNLRVHVERIIGSIRNRYKIWASRLPIHFFHGGDGVVPTVDKMILVCCALSNVNPTLMSVY